MSIFYSENTTSRLPIPASGITDANLILDVLHSGSERSLTLAELKKTGARFINPRQYGAVCNGSTDDTTAVQAALNAASGTSTVIIDGNSYITSSLTMPSGTKILGIGNAQFTVASG
jgi:polygalacturonase